MIHGEIWCNGKNVYSVVRTACQGKEGNISIQWHSETQNISHIYNNTEVATPRCLSNISYKSQFSVHTAVGMGPDIYPKLSKAVYFAIKSHNE